MATTRETDQADVASQLAALKDDIAKLGEAVKSLAAHEIRAGKQRVEAAAGAAAERVHDAYETVKDRSAAYSHEAADIARRQYHEIEVAIARNPLTAVGIAAAVGFLAGLVHRSSHR